MSNRSSPDIDKKPPLDNGTDNTPGEESPCLEDKTPPKKPNVVVRTYGRYQEKSGLPKKWFLIICIGAIVIFVLLFVIILLAALWPRELHERQYPVCEEPACLRLVSQIRGGLNESISPCDDVWNWSCDRWFQTHSLPSESSHWSQRVELYKQEAARVRNLITTLPLPLETSSVRWKLKHLYESCMDVDTVQADGVRPLKKIITELGGWSVLREWSVQSWDFRRTLERILAQHGAAPFFRISVEPHPRHPGKSNIVTIRPAGLGLPDRSFYYLDSENNIVSAYKRLIRDIVSIFEATGSDATKFSNDMFHFEKRLAEITPDTSSLEDPIATNNIISVSELKITASILPLREILVAMFPQGKITDDTEVLVVSLDYLTAVSVLISNTERSALNNYYMWTLVREYLPYLSSEVRDELHVYISELTGVKQPLERWEECAITTRRFMGLAVETLLEHEQRITDRERETVYNTFTDIRIATKSRISERNYPSNLEKHLMHKLSTLSLQVGLPQQTTTDGFLSEYYEKLYIQKSNLFQNVWNGFDFLRAEQQRRYIDPQMEDMIIPFITKQEASVAYSPYGNTVIVPQMFLREPFFNIKYPKSVIFGRLGIDIATAVASSVLPYGSMWTANKGLLTQYHPAYNESLMLITEPLSCLTQAINKQYINARDMVNSTVLNSIIHLNALFLAHKALKASLENEAHIHQATLEKYEDDSVFFLAYSQSHCSLVTPQYEFLQNTVKANLIEKARLMIAWTQLKSFSTSLSCSFDLQQCHDIF